MKKPTRAFGLILTSLLTIPGAALSAKAMGPSSAESSRTEHRKIIPICSGFIAYRFRDEVDLFGKSDKYKHCSLSCVMTLYCGPMGALEVGALKELYDALGFGTPDIEDLRADVQGIKAGLTLGLFQERNRCYQACSTLFP
jgi:hypothetical protein